MLKIYDLVLEAFNCTLFFELFCFELFQSLLFQSGLVSLLQHEYILQLIPDNSLAELKLFGPLGNFELLKVHLRILLCGGVLLRA